MPNDYWISTNTRDNTTLRYRNSVIDNTSFNDETFSLWGEWQKLREGRCNPCSEIILDSTTITKAPLKIKLGIKRVIFNDPATIIYWEDGTKTVVKVQDGEAFDEEKGFAMAVLKKMLGNEGNYYNEIRKWVK